MQRTYALLLLAIGMGLSTTASAQQASADARYCAKLIGLYRTYVNNPEDPRPTFQSPVASAENAIASCKAGNTAAGIPVLEQALRDNKFTLPSRGDG
jgi:hypothetical protein